MELLLSSPFRKSARRMFPSWSTCPPGDGGLFFPVEYIRGHIVVRVMFSFRNTDREVCRYFSVGFGLRPGEVEVSLIEMPIHSQAALRLFLAKLDPVSKSDADAQRKRVYQTPPAEMMALNHPS